MPSSAAVPVPVQRGSLACSASSHGPEMSSPFAVVVAAGAFPTTMSSVVVAAVVAAVVVPGSDTVRAGWVSSTPAAKANPPVPRIAAARRPITIFIGALLSSKFMSRGWPRPPQQQGTARQSLGKPSLRTRQLDWRGATAHSSSGLGHRPLTAAARVRIPYGPSSIAWLRGRPHGSVGQACHYRPRALTRCSPRLIAARERPGPAGVDRPLTSRAARSPSPRVGFQGWPRQRAPLFWP